MQYILPLQRKCLYNVDDFIFSGCNQELKGILNNLSTQWGYNPYPEIILLTGEAKSGKTHFSYILQYYKPDLVIIDNIEGERQEEYLLHRFNVCHESNKNALIICKEYRNFILPDLKSRLASVRSIHISPPDDEMVQLLLIKGLTERSIKVSDEVIKYLSTRIPRNYNSIETVVKLIDKLSIEQKRNINVHFLASLNIYS